MDASKVKETFIPRAAALRLADEELASPDDPDTTPTITIPAINFDGKISDMSLLGKEMTKWLKRAIGAC
jgi:hypothetical protein